MQTIINPEIDVLMLANCTVFTAGGEQIQLGQVWHKQKAILVFLRHFACIACRAHATQVWKDRDKYESTGSKLVFVGNGQPEAINGFKEDLGIQQALVLTDPSLESFRAAGFHRGFFYIVQMRSVVNVGKLLYNGHRQAAYTKEAGTHWQLGGLLAVNPNGQILYHYISESLGDFPEEPNFDVIQKDEARQK